MRASDLRTAQPKDSQAETRQRLLDAAGPVFAEGGFRAATVREICRRAGANVAAVNYHFGDKEGLYEALLRYAGRHAGALHAPSSGSSSNLDAEGRLRGFVERFLSRILGRGRPAWQAKLLAREMIEPSPALDSLVTTEMRPLFEELEAVCRELLGQGATEAEGRLTARSIIGQCLHYRHSQAVIARLHPKERFGPESIRSLAEHITEFSLGGIERLARKRGRQRGAVPENPESDP